MKIFEYSFRHFLSYGMRGIYGLIIFKKRFKIKINLKINIELSPNNGVTYGHKVINI